MQYVAIAQLRVTLQRNGILLASAPAYHKTTLLRSPLVEVDVINIDLVAECVPFRVGNVADDMVVYLHSGFLN